MSQLIDNLIAFRILHILLTPIEKSDAFRLGIIDKNGKQLKTPKTEEERDSFTILNKLTFKIKNIIKKNVQGERDLQSIATSMHVVKECLEHSIEPDNLEEMFLESLNNITGEDIMKVRTLINEDVISFEYFSEDAPVNNASATSGVDGFTSETLGVRKSKVLKRKKIKDFKSF